MSDARPSAPGPTPKPTLDDDTLAFAARVFGYARGGHAPELAELLGMGLPPNLRNEKGDSLLMLASYHGHADAVRVLLDHGGDPELANDRGQTPLAAAAFKGDPGVVRLCTRLTWLTVDLLMPETCECTRRYMSLLRRGRTASLCQESFETLHAVCRTSPDLEGVLDFTPLLKYHVVIIPIRLSKPESSSRRSNRAGHGDELGERP